MSQSIQLCQLVGGNSGVPRMASDSLHTGVQCPRTELDETQHIERLIIYFILPGLKEDRNHAFFLGPKNQTVDGIEHIFTMCACREGFMNDQNVTQPCNPWT